MSNARNSGSASDSTRVRVLIADDEALLASRLAEFLEHKGFSARTVRTGQDAYEEIQLWEPELVLYDLMLPGINAIQFLHNSSTQKALIEHKCKFVVVSGHNNPHNVRECLRAGAVDYIRKPFSHQEVLGRLAVLIRARGDVANLKPESITDRNIALYYLHLTDLTLREAVKGAPIEKALFNLAGMIGLSFGAVRTSIVKCDLDARTGVVLASSDRRHVGTIQLDLGKYPEFLHVLNSDRLLAIDNVGADPALHFLTQIAKSISFNSLIVAPIRIGGHIWGVISMRMPESRQKPFSEFEIRYAQLVGGVIGLTLSRDPANFKIESADGFDPSPEDDSDSDRKAG